MSTIQMIQHTRFSNFSASNKLANLPEAITTNTQVQEKTEFNHHDVKVISDNPEANQLDAIEMALSLNLDELMDFDILVSDDFTISEDKGEDSPDPFIDRLLADLSAHEDSFAYTSPRTVMNTNQRFSFVFRELVATKVPVATDVNNLMNQIAISGDSALMTDFNSYFRTADNSLKTRVRDIHLEMFSDTIKTSSANVQNAFNQLMNNSRDGVPVDKLEQEDIQALEDILEKPYIGVTNSRQFIQSNFPQVYNAGTDIQTFVTALPAVRPSFNGRNSWAYRRDTLNLYDMNNITDPGMDAYFRAISARLTTFINPGVTPANNNMVNTLMANLRANKTAFIGSPPNPNRQNFVARLEANGVPGLSPQDQYLIQDMVRSMINPATGAPAYPNFGINPDTLTFQAQP